VGLLYFAYVFFRNIPKKYFIIAFIFSGFLVFVLLVKFDQFLYQQLRFDADTSTLTRMSIYTAMIKNIFEACFVFPAGIGAHRAFMDQNFMGYPVHNDILEYIFNLGAVFYIFMGFIIRKMYMYSLQEKNYFIIVLVLYFSTALHNELFSVYIWVPLFMILSLYFESTKLVSYEV
jgi:hypothetical protein